MNDNDDIGGPIMRLFHVETQPGAADELMKKFATTSADVVQHEPGNAGYLFGRGVSVDENVVIFASFWENLRAVKDRFGADWQTSFLPPGYEALIKSCSVQHIDISGGVYLRLKE